MIAFLLANWRSVLSALGAAGATAALAWGLHSLDVARIDLAHRIARDGQKTALIAQCESSKKITQEVSDAYQKNVADLDARVAELKRMRDLTKCVCPPHAAPRCDAPGSGGFSGQDGATVGAFIALARDAEATRRQLTACQDFIQRERR